MVTCTDMAVLAGAYPEACYAKYGSFPLKTKHCHEQALRILLACIDSHAARHGRYITPLLSVHINFYVRVFVRVRTGKSSVKLSPTKVAYLYSCSGCDSFALQPMARVVDRGTHEKVSAGQGPPVSHNCEHCGRVHHVGGPLWTAPLHDADFVQALLRRLHAPGGAAFGAQKRLVGLLTMCAEELPEVPLFMHLAHMCSTLHLPCPQVRQHTRGAQPVCGVPRMPVASSRALPVLCTSCAVSAFALSKFRAFISLAQTALLCPHLAKPLESLIWPGLGPLYTFAPPAAYSLQPCGERGKAAAYLPICPRPFFPPLKRRRSYLSSPPLTPPACPLNPRPPNQSTLGRWLRSSLPSSAKATASPALTPTRWPSRRMPPPAPSGTSSAAGPSSRSASHSWATGR